MIELVNTTNNPQTVLTGQNVVFADAAVHSGCAERWREGSGQITLVQPGRYLVTFSGNIAIPAGGTEPGEVSLALSQQGEVLPGSIMRANPAAANQYFNVSTQHYVDVYRNGCGSCCQTVSVTNAGTQGVSVDNPNLTAVRVCG